MKRSLTIVFSVLFMLGLTVSAWAQAPSTEGQDFWVAYLLHGPNTQDEAFELIFSAQETCDVTVNHPGRNWNKTYTVQGNTTLKIDMIQEGLTRKDIYPAERKNNDDAPYTEQIINTALHVTSTKNISLFAANHCYKSTDATNILPTTTLLDDYYIQCYPAYDHQNDPHGSHFGIIAVEDNTVVDYELTAKTNTGKTGSQFTSTLNKGDVWYVWTGHNEGEASDLSGTHIKARDGKKIAVFEGNPHTNVPYNPNDANQQFHSRDHIVNQAVPIAYWGTQFAITSTVTTIDDKGSNVYPGYWERIDKIRILALNDGTNVYVDGNLVHTFDFINGSELDKKHTFEFDYGAIDEWTKTDFQPYPAQTQFFQGCNHYITTDCPVGVHQILTSNQYDHDKERKIKDPNTGSTITYKSCNGDPSLLWVSPIEQVIKKVTFATYNTCKDHFVNIVTTDPGSMTMDNGTGAKSIASDFKPMTNEPNVYYARLVIEPGSYTLSNKAGFIAYAYGFGEEEAYAYSCGSSCVSQSIVIDGEHLEVDSISKKHICINTPIDLSLNIGNNTYDHIVWDFGDGVSETIYGTSQASHTYTTPGWMDLSAAATYTNTCTGKEYQENVAIHFYVQEPTLIRKDTILCLDSITPSITFLDTTYSDPCLLDFRTQDMGECDSIIQWRVHVGKSEDYPVDTVGTDELWYRGKYYVESTPEGKRDTFHVFAADGCDTIEYVKVIVKHCLKLSPKPTVKVAYDCRNTGLYIRYQIGPRSGITGQLSDAANIQFRFGNLAYPAVANNNDTTFYIDLTHLVGGAAAEPIVPGVYNGTMHYEDPVCGTEYNDPITFTVYYPESIFDFVYTNVLAVRTKTSGYTFTGFQWYRNGQPMMGENKSILYFDEENYLPEHSTDMYYVELTREDGTTICTCPKSYSGANNMPYFAPERKDNQSSGQKMLRSGKLYIVTDQGTFDSYGNRVK